MNDGECRCIECCRACKANDGYCGRHRIEACRHLARAAPQADQQAVGEGFALIERDIVPVHVGEKGARILALCKQMGYDDETTAMMVFTEMVLAADPPTAKPSDQQGASLEGDVGRLAAAVLWAREEWADKEHVARCRGDIPLADYYGRCKDSMNAALASKASPDDQRQEGVAGEPQRLVVEWLELSDDGQVVVRTRIPRYEETEWEQRVLSG